MSYSLGNTGQNPFGTAAPANTQVQNGADLEEIQTEGLGFLSIAGEAKVQLLPSPWPSENLPPPTASLLSIAPHKGLLAAAGPDAVIIASTESVRKAFEGPRSGDSHVRPFTPQMTIPMPNMRISQVAFTADENHLVLSAENGGGLAVYDVHDLLGGSVNPKVEISTDSRAVRALIPNPTAEKAEYLAVVTSDGKLMMANIMEGKFLDGPNGPVMKEGVSCVSWSTKGKQLVAGLGDGTAYQMTPEGVGKAEIPRPSTLDNNYHVSSISWLENNVFLMIHTPSSFDSSTAPTSEFHIVTRTPPTEFMFQKIADPAAPFGLNRSPPHHFLLRLKDFPPNLQDLLIVASTASTDIGLFSRSKSPLVSDKPAEKITGVFTMTEMSDDSRRAQLSMTEDMNDTSPIGIAFDLSSRDRILKPIPSDEIAESPTPLPGLMVLNNEGILASWWIVYSESIRQGTAYPGLVAVAGTQQASTFSSTQGVPSQPKLAFGAPPSQGSPFSTPIATSSSGSNNGTGSGAFGSANTAFGAGTAFGVRGGLGRDSPWGKPETASPSPTVAQSAIFGSSSVLGSKPPQWSSGPQTATFGQTGGSAVKPPAFGTSSTGAVFGANAFTAPSSGGFMSYANGGGFTADINKQTAGQNGSIFGQKPASGSFAAPSGGSGIEVSTSFGQPEKNPPATLSSFGNQGFNLGSTFKSDGSAKDDLPKSAAGSFGSMFDNNFGKALGETQQPPTETASPEADMEDDRPVSPIKPSENVQQNLDAFSLPKTATTTTPSSTPAGTKFGMHPVTPPIKSNLFSLPQSSTPSTTAPKPAEVFSGEVAPANGNQPESTAISKPSGLFQTPLKSDTVKIKQEAEEDDTLNLQSLPEPPLPPDTTSKASFTAGDSLSSSENDAPLPPDWTAPSVGTKPEAPKTSQTVITPSMPESPKKSTITEDMIPPSDVPGGPEEEEDDDSDFQTEEDEEADQSDFTGSGEDVTQDLSPASESQPTPSFTPQTSSALTLNRGDSSSFTKIGRPPPSSAPRPLFGEITSTNAPILAPPKSLVSPRSPSPMRSSIPGRLIRPDASRSVSAPHAASQMLSSKPPSGPSSTYTKTLEQKQAEERRQSELIARREAEEAQALIDEEDVSTQRYLETPLVGTKHLDEFIAHQNYVGNADQNSIPAQVEAVYRDINSMIDTLGVNSRALQSFIKGHTEGYKDPARTRKDLEIGEDWCLVEIEKYLESIITKDLTSDLDSGRVKDVADKIDACDSLEKDLIRLRAKQEDLRLLMSSKSDSEQQAINKAQPLTSEQASQQHDLRRDFTNFQKLLGEAEEALTLLRAKLASRPSSGGKPSAGPTVEAVMKTIMKMTSMAEKRSGDVDVLENQMRKLRMSSVASARSRENSPFATPANKASTMRIAGTASTHGEFYTPNSIRDSPSRFRNSLASSVNSVGGRGSPLRKKMSGFSDEDKSRLKNDAAQRKLVLEKLRTALQTSGPRMRLMDDDDDYNA